MTRKLTVDEIRSAAFKARFLGYSRFFWVLPFRWHWGVLILGATLFSRKRTRSVRAYLRASFLPPPHQTAVETLLRSYVDLRLPLYDSDTSSQALESYETRSAQVQRQLWAHAVASGREAPSPLIVAFVTALNEVIDLDASRLHALRSHVPGAAWLLLLLVSGVGCYISGYAAGLSGARTAFSTILLPLLIAIVITLISDLDAPRRGIIGISKQPLLDLRQSLHSPSR